MGCLAAIGFWPAPVDKPIRGTLAAVLSYLHTHGIPRWLGYNFLEATANLLMFIPLGILIANAFPSRTWWQLAAVGALTSVTMEVGQLLFITDRFSSLSDVVNNTAGAVIGIAFTRLVSSRVVAEPAKP